MATHHHLPAPARLHHGQLTVLHDPVPGPLTAIALVIRAGSRFDGRHPGIAHMAEHMLFQGTPALDQATINRRAGELGGEHDADTGYEDMSLHFEVFNDDLDAALALLAEQSLRSTVPDDRFAKERRVVIDEIRGRAEDPLNYAHESAWGRFFGGPLAHPVCGTVSSLRRLRAADVRRFIHRHFVPANMVLAVVGGASRGKLRRALERHFPRRGPKPPSLPSVSRGRAGVQRLRRQDFPQSYLVRLMSAPTAPRDLLALSLAVEIVGADPDARLFQEVRERLGLGYELSASVEQGSDWAVAVVAGSASRRDARTLATTIDRTCQEAAAGFSAEELARARRKVRYRFARLADSRLDRALVHATRAAHRQPPLAITQQLLGALTHAEVERAWRRVLRAPRLTTILHN